MDDLEVDLANLLRERIHEAVMDTMDTAKRGGMAAEGRMTMAMTVLVTELVAGLMAMGRSELAAVQLCSMAYKEVVKLQGREKLKARKR